MCPCETCCIPGQLKLLYGVLSLLHYQNVVFGLEWVKNFV